jgi:hypothetical protein
VKEFGEVVSEPEYAWFAILDDSTSQVVPPQTIPTCWMKMTTYGLDAVDAHRKV